MISTKAREVYAKCHHVQYMVINFYNKTKWFLLIVGLIIFFKLWSFKLSQNEIDTDLKNIHQYFEERDNSYLLYDAACRIPKLDPFHSNVLPLLKEGPQNFTCEDEFQQFFQSTFTSTLVPLKSLGEMEVLGIKTCCYKTIHRNGSDNEYRLSDQCYNVSLVDETTVRKEHEFIAILCEQWFLNSTTVNVTVTLNETISTNETAVTNMTNFMPNKTITTNETVVTNVTITKIVDMHAFVHLDPIVEERVKNITAKEQKLGREVEGKLNVVLFGLDAVSHMNFLRTMPESYSFLMKNLSAVEMQGYHKVGRNTLPNAVAFLTSQTLTKDEIISSCEVDRTYDDCPFIWKAFAEHGFRTSFGEDAPWMSIFNYLKKGFRNPPTDYYLRHFGKAAEAHISQRHRKEKTYRRDQCHGPRLSFQTLLNYIQKLAYSMGPDKRYFQFIWETALTHDNMNNGLLGDKYLRSTLEWFHNGGYLNQTIFILLSDHGRTWGKIMDYEQGQVENRMPFLFFVIPEWFKKKYALAFQNLLKNQDKLTTPFDLYETLKDLVTLEDITAEDIPCRELSLRKAEKKQSFPRGVSLFLPIPLSRTCKMAGIEAYYCVCRNLTQVLTNDTATEQAANYAISVMNSILSNDSQCASLSLSNVKSSKSGKVGVDEDYQIIFETTPGNASFEAAVLRDENGIWNISETIDRTNSYGNQSYCVDTRLKKLYCFCNGWMSTDEVQSSTVTYNYTKTVVDTTKT